MEASLEKVLSRQKIFSGRAVSLKVDSVRLPDGREATREIVEHADCVAVVAVDGKGDLVLVRQFRSAVGKELLEIVAGGIEDGETPEEAAIREMREETGYRPGRLIKLGGFYSAPGYSTEYLHLYLATDLIPDPLKADDTPEIETVVLPRQEILELILSGAIRDAKTIAGILFYFHFKS